MTDQPIESNAVRVFRAKCETALAKINNYKQWEAEEEMVHEVMEAGRTLFGRPLDEMDPDTLLRLGGRLAGSYGYLGQRNAYARGERDVFAQKLDETEKELILNYLADGKYKVTEARARVSAEVAVLNEFVIQKETAKNQWENLLDACDRMIGFIQSAIKVKEAERFQAGRMSNQG